MGTVSNNAQDAARRWNRAVPGAGLILRGDIAAGLGLGVTFAASANTLLVAMFVLPDDVTLITRVAALAAAAGSYWLAQWRLDRVREAPDPAAVALRRRALAEATAALRAGRADEALAQLAALEPLAERDLLVAYRLAQAETLAGRAERAREAWRRVRRLDRAGLYKEETRRGEQLLRSSEETAKTAPRGPGEVSRGVDPIAPGGR